MASTCASAVFPPMASPACFKMLTTTALTAKMNASESRIFTMAWISIMHSSNLWRVSSDAHFRRRDDDHGAPERTCLSRSFTQDDGQGRRQRSGRGDL